MDPGRITLLGVPIDSVGEAGGTERGPAALRGHLSPGFRDAGDTELRLRGGERDPDSGWLDFQDVVAMSAEVRERVAAIVAAGEIPLILGGCCSLLPAALAGARDSLSGIGLAYFDGHLDLFTGETSPTGEAADMPVAATIGLAPPALVDAIGPVPVVEPARHRPDRRPRRRGIRSDRAVAERSGDRPDRRSQGSARRRPRGSRPLGR